MIEQALLYRGRRVPGFGIGAPITMSPIAITVPGLLLQRIPAPPPPKPYPTAAEELAAPAKVPRNTAL